MSPTDDQLLASASSQRVALDGGAVSAVELTRAYLDRIAAVDGGLRGFVHVEPELALAQAAEADRRLRAGERSPVLGLSLGFKDIIDVAGMPTTYGSRAFAGNIARHDADVVARLRRAGGVILGKANTFEFALVMPSALHREARNPWGARRVAGGSSNGSAVAAAAGLCAVAIGTDTAGSIRNPASYCGVTGLKPSHGRVSLRGVGVLSSSMDTVGTMARGVADCALALQAMAGYDPDDPHSCDTPVGDYAVHPGEMVIGVPESWFPEWVAPEIEAHWREMIARISSLGFVVRTVRLPDLGGVFEIWAGLAASEALDWHEPHLARGRADYGSAALLVLDQLKTLPAAAHSRARRAAFELRRAMEAAMEGVNVLVVPTNPTTAFTFEEARDDRILSGEHILDSGTATTGLTRPFSVTGQPALAVPSGIACNGMPLSLQVVGRRFDEAAVFRAARLIEAFRDFDPVPPMFRNAGTA